MDKKMIEDLFSIMLLLFVFVVPFVHSGQIESFWSLVWCVAFISASFIVKFPTSRKVECRYIYEMNKENVAKVQFHSFGSFKGWPVWNFFLKFLICWVWKNVDRFRLWQTFFEYLQISSEVYSCCHTLPVVYISPYYAWTSTSVMQTPPLPSSTDQMVATLTEYE